MPPSGFQDFVRGVLNCGLAIPHACSMTVTPKAPGVPIPTPAELTYTDSLDGSDVFTHSSDSLEQLVVLSLQEKYIVSALWLGR